MAWGSGGLVRAVSRNWGWGSQVRDTAWPDNGTRDTQASSGRLPVAVP